MDEDERREVGSGVLRVKKKVKRLINFIILLIMFKLYRYINLSVTFAYEVRFEAKHLATLESQRRELRCSLGPKTFGAR